MTYIDFDRELVARVTSRAPGAWREFVDRFACVVIEVHRSLQGRSSAALSPEAQSEMLAEIFQSLRDNDFELLRRHDQRTSLAIYLTVVVRRLAIESFRSGASRLN